MLNHGDDMAAGKRPDVSSLLETLAHDTRDWAQAEVTLAQIELAELKTSALRAAGLAAIGASLLLCILLALTQAGIALLAPHASAAGAALIVAAGLALPCIWCAHAARRAAAWRTASIFFRWLGSQPGQGTP